MAHRLATCLVTSMHTIWVRIAAPQRYIGTQLQAVASTQLARVLDVRRA